ncbi:MAG: TIGR03790 family protein [Gloeobacteraceae cyanobacterium ES-bin-144]|nr:TIGR03790 family protein [Verrucomicrobiales bacterium]
MFREMRSLALALLLLAVIPPRVIALPAADSVAILYNSAIPESRKLAEFYAEARGIPALNLIALNMPITPDISRQDYQKKILEPLRDQFDQRGWWNRATDGGGVILPVVCKIRVLVTVRGVPLRIQQTPQPAPPPPKPGTPPPPPQPQDPFKGHDEASVDSELAMFGVDGVPMEGSLQNKFYQSTKPITGLDFPFLVLTARIDAPSYLTCERMIRDAIETEKAGLWGMAYVDIANKIPQGDQWMETVVKENVKVGIPTVVDRFNDTFPKNYPMSDAALYYGWYDGNVSGPFLNTGFRFKKGAVAMHLHSFSADQLTNGEKNWSGPLLERGAAVTVGNVYEPYLHLTHDFGIIQQRLLAGDCWVEACWKAMPAASWQGVVLGDPLYRPFIHLDGGGELVDRDRDFRALRAAFLKWPNDSVQRGKQLGMAAVRMNSGVLAEAVGLDLLQRGLTAEALIHFGTAKSLYVRSEDKLRQDFHLIAIDRAANRKDLAVRGLRDAQTRYGVLPEADALKGWLDILDPPPPPPADPTKLPGAHAPAPKKP